MTPEQKPAYAWHELLTPIKPPPPKDTGVFEIGKRIHAHLEAIIRGKVINEPEFTYRDADLPFDIKFHPDVVSQEMGIDGAVKTYVYEIKPLIWFLTHRIYCEAQASGYWHFTGATSCEFVLYWLRNHDPKDISLSVVPCRRVPWPELRYIASVAWAEIAKVPSNG